MDSRLINIGSSFISSVGTTNITDVPASNGLELTPSDAEDLPIIPRAIYISADGDVVVTFAESGSSISLGALTAGTLLPIRIRKLNETTTATVVALW